MGENTPAYTPWRGFLSNPVALLAEANIQKCPDEKLLVGAQGIVYLTTENILVWRRVLLRVKSVNHLWLFYLEGRMEDAQGY